jgi:DNA-binding XRE family transcriptional regulator
MQAGKGKHCQAFAGHGIGVVSHYRLLVRAVVVRPSVGGSKLPIWPQIALPYYPNTVTINLQWKNRIRVRILLAVQCKMARAAIGWGVRDLAKEAGVSPDTIARLERGEELKASTIEAIRSALEAAGVEFIPENGGGAGVRLKP